MIVSEVSRDSGDNTGVDRSAPPGYWLLAHSFPTSTFVTAFESSRHQGFLRHYGSKFVASMTTSVDAGAHLPFAQTRLYGGSSWSGYVATRN